MGKGCQCHALLVWDLLGTSVCRCVVQDRGPLVWSRAAPVCSCIVFEAREMVCWKPSTGHEEEDGGQGVFTGSRRNWWIVLYFYPVFHPPIWGSQGGLQSSVNNKTKLGRFPEIALLDTFHQWLISSFKYLWTDRPKLIVLQLMLKQAKKTTLKGAWELPSACLTSNTFGAIKLFFMGLGAYLKLASGNMN